MADITITCGNCGNRITVSEYVDAEFLTCRNCKQKVTVPAQEPAAVAPQARLKLSQQPATAQAAASGEASGVSLADEIRKNTPAMKRLRRRRRGHVGLRPAIMASVIFVILAAALAYLRFYPGAMPEVQRDLLIKGAIAALGFLHVSVIAYAFTDEAFHGVMCTIIPGYSLYYLFIHADQFLLRAVVGALLIAFGADTALFIRTVSHDVYVDVSAWIHDTDTFKKDRVPGGK